MNAVHLTPAEAHRLGIDAPGARTRTTRRVARGPYLTRCRCGAVFTTQASEDRHVAVAGGHLRFECVLDRRRP